MVELRVVVSDELAERLARRAREQHTTAERLASRAGESLYGHPGAGGQAKPGFVALGASDAHHAACAALFSNPPDQLVVPVSVLVEVPEGVANAHGDAAHLSTYRKT